MSREPTWPAFSHPTSGIELDWLAIDLNEHVGVFSTGGRGPVPEIVMGHPVEIHAAVARLGGLPVLGACTAEPPGSGNYSFWTEPCRRGIFGFDWGAVASRPFARMTVPSRPIAARDINDPDIRAAAELVRLPIRFLETTKVDELELGIALYVV